MGMTVVTTIGIGFGTGSGSGKSTGGVCAGVGVGLGVRMIDGSREIARYRSLAMHSIAMIVVSP